MPRIKSVDELKTYREKHLESGRPVMPNRDTDMPVIVKIAMATCSLAAGAGKIMQFMTEELEKRGIDASIVGTGCMGYCYAEPTIEVTLPGQEPVVFGYVDLRKADHIIERYIKQGELVDGVIPVNYKKVEEL